MLRCASLATIFLFAAAASLSAQPASPAEPAPSSPPAVEAPNSPDAMEDPQLGDHWTYQLKDEITGEIKSTITYTITDVSTSEIRTRTGILGKSDTGYATFDRSWNTTNNGIWRFTPNDGTGVRPPLAVGKTWSFKDTEVNTMGGFSARRTGSAKVIAQESVTTRAGTFDTFKVETSYQLQSSNDPTKKFQIVQQMWYSPVIDHWVKRTFVSKSDGQVRENSSLELVEYGRR
jgi:hypothetical protein